jgi:cellulose synthase/poly-beta-1,6-N-acetylglucosamine synthase-like glycosyltransferase
MLVLASFVLLILTFVDMFEVVDLFRRRASWRQPSELTHSMPKRVRIAVHVPVYSEPPDVVLRNLEALAEVRHRLVEVLVVDNNTADENLWLPLQDFCSQMGESFRFFHVPTLPGNKAGALNYALARTDPDIDVIVVLDADYVIQPNFIEKLEGCFAGNEVVFVQAPQAYLVERPLILHDFLMLGEYWQFFSVGMELRNLRNSIMLHGTMVAVRRSAIEAVGGWAEWCLTDDSEMGIRLLAEGGRAVYLPTPMGYGVLPVSHSDFLKQRRRWVMGGAQQFRHHFHQLVRGRRSPRLSPTLLSTPQRLHILQGWVSWSRDAALTILLVPVVLGLIVDSDTAGGAYMEVAGWTAVGSITANIAKQLLIYWVHLHVSLALSVATTGFILGMTTTVAMAWVWGLIPGRRSFFRTPKRRIGRSFPMISISDLAVAVTCSALAWQVASGSIRFSFMLYALLGVLGVISPFMRQVTISAGNPTQGLVPYTIHSSRHQE